jgi:hypothetical protein
MDGATSTLSYTALAGSEIRLVKLVESRAGDDQLGLSLEHCSLVNPPPYYALSYVWGDASETRPILVHGHPFNATMNLYNALVQFRELLPELQEGLSRTLELDNADVDVLIWIDAICINQQNIHEKEKQLPLMGDIYSTAFTVIIWLGLASELQYEVPYAESDADFKALAQYLNATIYPIYIGCSHLEIEEDGLAVHLSDENIHLLLTAIGIASTPWFFRRWVVQEWCLSQREPLVFLGRTMLSLRSLYLFVKCASASTTIEPGERKGIEYMIFIGKSQIERALGAQYLPKLVRDAEFRSKTIAEQFLWIHDVSAERDATYAHDMLYSMLGLIDAARLPLELRPNYSQPLPKLRKDFTRFTIHQAKNLCLLAVPSLPGEPSWVADLRSSTYFSPNRESANVSEFIPNPWAGLNHLEPHCLHPGHFTMDGNGLVVEGHHVGSPLENSFQSLENDHSERITHFYENFLAVAAQTRKEPLRSLWHTWLSKRLEEMYNILKLGEIENLNQADTPRQLLEVLGTVGRGEHQKLLSRILDVRVSDDLYILLDNGDILTISTFNWPNHHNEIENAQSWEVWAFKGAMFFSLVRRLDTGMYIHVSVSNTLVKLDSEYFSTRKVERITLV